MKTRSRTRIEKDSLGELAIPADAYFGIQSYRAARNFPISGTQVHPELLASYLKLKRAAARANQAVGALDPKRARAITRAADELLAEKPEELARHFVVDAYQAGAGTSQNMNANEVLANKANELLGHALGAYDPVHPNDHVNMSQSTNDTYPTALRLATLALAGPLVEELDALAEVFAKKARKFDGVLKAARTHLQDAVPIRLGQEFAAYADTVARCARLVDDARTGLRELGIGGSAAGTGINVPKGYGPAIVKELRRAFRDPRLEQARDLRAAMQSQLPVMVYSNALRAAALELTRIVNDLRLLASGPSTGLAELRLPSTQPGSSIMPGKVNPSILEMVNQVLFKVLGNDSGLAFAMQAGQLELNVMMPVMAQLVLESSAIMAKALAQLRLRCVEGIDANRERCRAYAENTTQIATALNPVLGYGRAGELAKEALATGKSVVELVREKKLLTEKQIRSLLDPKKLT
ncbi:MAG: aspartate ammonia-lyase [Deltaproteobacteria bacterium]|nr:aspartate ammonia-lyase [Deltaproteobacteria bacterium]